MVIPTRLKRRELLQMAATILPFAGCISLGDEATPTARRGRGNVLVIEAGETYHVGDPAPSRYHGIVWASTGAIEWPDGQSLELHTYPGP